VRDLAVPKEQTMTSKNLSSSEVDRWMKLHIPYRIRALEGLDIYNESGAVDGVLRDVFPSIFGSCLMHCRSLLDFLGVEKKGRSLIQKQKRKYPTDVHVIDLGGQLLNPSTLPTAQAQLLLRVYEGAHRASAHLVDEGAHTMIPEDVGEAATIIRRLVKQVLYDVKGVTPPNWTH